MVGMFASPEELLQEIEAGEDSFLDFKEVGFEGRRDDGDSLRLEIFGARPVTA